MRVVSGQGTVAVDLVSLPHVFCKTFKSEVEGGSEGLRGQNKQTCLKFHAFAEDIVVFEVLTIESKGERDRGKRVYRESSEGREQVIEV